MKEIKFRGKRLDNGKWVYGFPSYNKAGEAWIRFWNEASNSKEFGKICCIPVDPETVGQFIINEDGNDIYEGDIIQEFKHGVLKRQFIANDIRTFIREYDKAEHGSEWKVVGTIYAPLKSLEVSNG